MSAIQLQTRQVEKIWGRTDVPGSFAADPGLRVGEIWFEHPGGVIAPLLVKYIFTSEKLSIQVHPNDAQGQAKGLAGGKEECWYILDAQPGATLGIGTVRPLSDDELRAAALDGEIEALMDWKPVSAGDFYFIPAGTVHAIGAGVTLVEVQQNVDITYRLYDYGRPRELHLDDGVAVSRARPYDARACSIAPGGDAALLDRADAPFGLAMRHLPAGGHWMKQDDAQAWFIPLRGHGRIDGGPWSAGQCWLVEGPVRIETDAGADYLLATL